MDYLTIYDKVSFKDFKSATQALLDSIPNSASLAQAIAFILQKYKENRHEYDTILSKAIERNFKHYDICSETMLFYILMSLRTRYQHFFPAPSLCVLMSHALRGQIRKHKEAKLHIKNIELLPIVLLISHEINEIIVEDQNEISLAVKQYLLDNNQKNPEKWNFSLKKTLKNKGIALTQFPLPHTTIDNTIFEQLEKYEAGIVFTSWNFLASAEYKDLRFDLIKRCLLDTVIQLPLPQREGNKNYPAALILNKTKTQSIRMVDLNTFNKECVSQVYLDLDCEGIVNDSVIHRFNDGYLQEIFGNIINKESFPWAPKGQLYKSYSEKYEKITSLDVPLGEILVNPSHKISPLLYITEHRSKNDESLNKTTLSDIAEVIRCQEARTSIKGLDKDKIKTIDAYGTIYRDISLKDIDPLSNFLIFDHSDFVQMQLHEHQAEKYTLKDNDIVLAFKGSRATIGKVAFVDLALNEDPLEKDNFISIDAVCSTSLVIVRAKKDKINPLWLFHFLQEKNTQEMLCSKATGSSVLSINLKTIRELPITLPKEDIDNNKELWELENIEKHYQQLAEYMKQIVFYKRKIEELKNTNILPMQ